MASLGQITRLRAYSREPFRELLDQWLANGPTDEQIQKIAAKTPDRWTQGLAVIGRLAGYTERTEITRDVDVLHVSAMSDAALEMKLAQVTAQLEAYAQPQTQMQTQRLALANQTPSKA
jgi:hypothetical protein